MHSREFYDLADVTDAELHANLAQLLIVGYRTEARIVAHLAEVEERRLHLRGGSSSMFDYCVQRLGLSNGEAFQRLTVARLARRFPLIYELIERREVHLTGLCLLRDYLTLDNHRELLAEASRKTKWQIQELLACRFPRADVPATIRKLPAPRSTSTQDPALPALPALPATTVSTRLPATTAPRASEATTASPAGARAAGAAASEALCWTGSGRVVAPQALPPRPLAAAAETPARARLEPTAADRYRLQLTVSSVLRDKLELARALLSHSVPSGDFAELIERALDELLAKTQKQRFGLTKSPRTPTATSSALSPSTTSRRGDSTSANPPRQSRIVLRQGVSRREHIPNATRREIVARDGLRCTFVSEDGRRCAARSFLQIHHERPWAKGGGSTAGNLRVLCAAHNRLLAEQDFGPRAIAARLDER